MQGSAGDSGIDRPLQGAVVVFVALLVYVLWPVVAGLVAGGATVLVLAPIFERLAASHPGHRRLLAGLATAVLSLGVIAPLIVIGLFAARETVAAVSWLSRALASGSDLGARLPPWLSPIFERGALMTGDLATRLALLAPRLASSAGRLLIQVFLAIVTVYTLFLRGPQLVAFLRRTGPLRRDQNEVFLADFADVVRSVFWGYLVAAVCQGAVATVGYWIAGVPGIAFLGAATFLASIVPVVGTAIVWIPVAAGLLVTGRYTAGVFIAAWGLLLVSTIDNLILPLASRGRARLPDLLLFLTMFGGLFAFGAKGLLIGPVIGSLAFSALRLAASDRTEPPR